MSIKKAVIVVIKCPISHNRVNSTKKIKI